MPDVECVDCKREREASGDGVDVAQIAHELGVSERTVVRRKKERAA